jgi:FlaA1/EpsC-like NDP-sugar epimerase
MKPDPDVISKSLFHYRHIARRIILGFAVVFSLCTAFLLRFEFSIPQEHLPSLLYGLLLALPVKLLVYYLLKLDRGGWRYLELNDLKSHGLGNLLASGAFAALAYNIIGTHFPRSIYCIDFVTCSAMVAAVLLGVRLYTEPPLTYPIPAGAKKVLVYGAGAAGRSLLREIQAHPSLGYHVLGFLDDDIGKKGMRYLGVAVLGTGREASAIVDKIRRHGKNVEEIIIAMPSASPRRVSEALANCRAASVSCRTVPSLAEQLMNKAATSQIRDIACANLLSREPVRLDVARLRAAMGQKCILVTGGGGSIGSELCRQLVSFSPAKLVILEQAETDLFNIHRELSEQCHKTQIIPVMGSIRSPQRVMEILRSHRPDSVFHAAAYKHVPMMELHPLEAAENNVVGTYNLLQAAMACHVSSFVMISSDKAVNPTNIMGLTKRVSEILVTGIPSASNGNGHKFMSVRFGNVLGSSGSVVPVFRTQIAAGGPVTVTHPEMRRYFMTIPEAVQLVLEASQMGAGGEIFVLDMGQPVRILDLAETMIRLAGRDPEEVGIRFTGVRPGEKMFEELSTSGEDVLPTHHPKIKIFRSGESLQGEAVCNWVGRLQELIEDRQEAAVVAHMASIVPEYTASARWAAAVQKPRQAAFAG